MSTNDDRNLAACEAELRRARQELVLQRHCLAWLATHAAASTHAQVDRSRPVSTDAHGIANWRFDADARTIDASPAFCSLFEVAGAAALTKLSIGSLLTERSHQQFKRALNAVENDLPVTIEVEIIGQLSGRHHHVALSLMRVESSSDERVFEAIAVDITIRRNDDSCTRFLAREDSLTGLPNRAAFSELTQQAITIARRNGSMLALLYIDLFGFRAISKTHGTLAGDRLLCETANRLQGITRESDCVGRLHGAEFALLATNLHQPAEAEVLVRKIAGRLADPFSLGGHPVACPSGIGLALYPADGADLRALFEIAEAALQRARSDREQDQPTDIRRGRPRKALFRRLPEPLRREEMLRARLEQQQDGPKTEAPRLP